MKRRSLPAVVLLGLILMVSVEAQQNQTGVEGAQSEDTNKNETTVRIGNLNWTHPIDRALRTARQKQKPVLLLRVLGHLNEGL